MTREFITTSIFDRRWSELGLSDDDLRKLEKYIIQNPGAGDMIEGTGGTIKLRYALHGRGKSGGIRVIYIDVIKEEHIYLITCYAKSKQDTLTDREKGIIKEAVKRILQNEREGLR